MVRSAVGQRVLAHLPAPAAMRAASHAQCFPARGASGEASAVAPPSAAAPRPFGGGAGLSGLGCTGTRRTLARSLIGLWKAGTFAHPP